MKVNKSFFFALALAACNKPGREKAPDTTKLPIPTQQEQQPISHDIANEEIPDTSETALQFFTCKTYGCAFYEKAIATSFNGDDSLLLNADIGTSVEGLQFQLTNCKLSNVQVEEQYGLCIFVGLEGEGLFYGDSAAPLSLWRSIKFNPETKTFNLSSETNYPINFYPDSLRQYYYHEIRSYFKTMPQTYREYHLKELNAPTKINDMLVVSHITIKIIGYTKDGVLKTTYITVFPSYGC